MIETHTYKSVLQEHKSKNNTQKSMEITDNHRLNNINYSVKIDSPSEIGSMHSNFNHELLDPRIPNFEPKSHLGPAGGPRRLQLNSMDGRMLKNIKKTKMFSHFFSLFFWFLFFLCV